MKTKLKKTPKRKPAGQTRALAVDAGSQSDSSMLDFIEANEAWITYASDHAKTDRAWRCQVAERRFPSPDIRERSGRQGYGKTARKAIAEAMRATTVPFFANIPNHQRAESAEG